MNFFIVIGCDEKALKIMQKVRDAYGDECHQVSAAAAVVSEGQGVTVQNLRDKIFGDEPDNDERGTYFIADFGPYWGYHKKDLWEWMQKRSGV